MAIEVKLFDNFRQVAADAGAALSRTRQKRLFDRLDWFELTARLGPKLGRPLIARADDNGARMWLFLAEKGRGHAEAYASWYTLGFAPIFTRTRDAEQRVALATAVARRLRRRFATIGLSPLSDDEGGATALETGFGRAGWLVKRSDATGNWIADTEEMDGDAYWADRPSRLRNTVRRKKRDADLSIEIHERFSPEAWADYEAIYRASWKPDEGAPAFLRALAEAEGAAGTLRLGIARSVGQPVAAQFWLVESGRATIHKLAHVEAAREASPGSILSEAMFRHVIDRDRPTVIDFGTGDDPYKADWMDERRPFARLDCYNRRSVTGLLRAGRQAVAKLVRRPARD